MQQLNASSLLQPQPQRRASAAGPAHLLGASSAAGARAVLAAAASPGITPQVAGALMLYVNQAGHTKRLGYDDVKAAINQAVQLVFPGGHVQVQPQGSTAKGTALPSSDWDFFLRMDNTIDTVTKRQRTQLAALIHQGLADKGVRYRMQLHSNRIRLYEGSNGQGVSVPDVDVITQRFKADQRLEPNNRALADSHVRQQVVKLIKTMPDRYTDLKAPKSFRVEEICRLVEEELGRGRGQLQGKVGFCLLLDSCLRKMSGELGTTDAQEEQLAQAGMRDSHWMHAARKYLKTIKGLSLGLS